MSSLYAKAYVAFFTTGAGVLAGLAVADSVNGWQIAAAAFTVLAAPGAVFATPNERPAGRTRDELGRFTRGDA